MVKVLKMCQIPKQATKRKIKEEAIGSECMINRLYDPSSQESSEHLIH